MKQLLVQTVQKSTKLTGIIVLSAALLTGCSSSQQTAATQANAVQALKAVKVAPIEKKKIGDPLEQVAEVVSSLQVDVMTKAGGDVREILKKRGDTVEKGEVILRLDPTDMFIQKDKAQVALTGTQQQLTKARQDLEDGKKELQNNITKMQLGLQDAEKNYNQTRNDYDSGLVTKDQLDLIETQLKTMRLDLDSARNKLNSLQTTNSFAQLEQGIQTANLSVREIDRNIDNMEVKANASGVITDLPIESGMTLAPGFRAAGIQMLDPIKLKAELTETAAAMIRGKHELTFYIPNTQDKMKAKVNYLADVMSSQTQSYSLELEVPNADRKLKPGMKAQILLADEADEIVVTVPTQSVVREGSNTFIFVLTNDQVEKRKVELGRLNGTFQEILTGAKEGEQIVFSGQHQLMDKDKVQVEK
jgi:HlyD family secretion protein